jgi:mxaK protein
MNVLTQRLRSGGLYGINMKQLGLRAVLAIALAVLAVSAWQFAVKQRANAAIDGMRAGSEVEVDAAEAPPEMLDARAAFFLRRDRIDEAQPLLDQALLRADAPIQMRMLFNMANARMRGAVAAIGKGDYDKAIPLVTLAKSEYRSALRLDPAFWDAKYNLDIAMRLVRDLPQAVGEDEEKPLQTPEKLWTDLPGVPKGLP